MQILSGINSREGDFFIQKDVQRVHLCSFNIPSVHLCCSLITVLTSLKKRTEENGKFVCCWKFSSRESLYICLKLPLQLAAFTSPKAFLHWSLPCCSLIVCSPSLLHKCFSWLKIPTFKSYLICFHCYSSSTCYYSGRSYFMRKPGRIHQPKTCQEKVRCLVLCMRFHI